MASFVRVASLSDLPAGQMLAIEVDGEDIVLANVYGKVFAFSNLCPHAGGLLVEGTLDGHRVECPFHGGSFNVRTGEVIDPPPEEAIATYEVQLDGDDIKVAKA